MDPPVKSQREGHGSAHEGNHSVPQVDELGVRGKHLDEVGPDVVEKCLRKDQHREPGLENSVLERVEQAGSRREVVRRDYLALSESQCRNEIAVRPCCVVIGECHKHQRRLMTGHTAARPAAGLPVGHGRYPHGELVRLTQYDSDRLPCKILGLFGLMIVRRGCPGLRRT
jgi:hypothetical protein